MIKLKKYKFVFSLLTTVLILLNDGKLFAQQFSINSFSANYSTERMFVSSSIGESVTAFYETELSSFFIGSQITDEEPFIGLSYYIQGLVHSGDSLLNFGIIKILNSETYTILDSFIIFQGEFLLENIPLGEYLLEADPKENAGIYYKKTYYANDTIIENAYKMPVRTNIDQVDLYLVLKPEFELNLKSMEMSVFPNPNQGSFYINYKLPEELKLTLEISDNLGTIINQKNLQGSSGENFFYYSFNQKTKQGIYLIKLYTENGLFAIQKVIKL